MQSYDEGTHSGPVQKDFGAQDESARGRRGVGRVGDKYCNLSFRGSVLACIEAKIHFLAVFEIYNICTRLHRPKLKM